MNRFFVDSLADERITLPSNVAHQVRRVLRLDDGERIVLLSGGNEAVCRLEGDGCIVEERRPSLGEAQHRLTVCQALLKGDHLEQVVQQGTEIGVARFRLLVSARCVARGVSAHKLARLRAIARESAEQSERGIVPEVHAPVPLAEVLEAGSVLLYERHGGERLSAIEPPQSVIIGPEGGFNAEEVAAAKRAGVQLAGLGPRILRSRSVAGAAAAVILSRTGDFA
ncbi:MAG: 16S rRNA (uracil(1498)-N(3))-methyltransferase [Chloroflexota bacterium]|nr:16S rRNA (uracil(1498)-N(3))-methyltransferase [Chloroflexota bacterium]